MIRKDGLSTEQFPVSTYVGSSKNLKDLKESHVVVLGGGGGHMSEVPLQMDHFPESAVAVEYDGGSKFIRCTAPHSELAAKWCPPPEFGK